MVVACCLSPVGSCKCALLATLTRLIALVLNNRIPEQAACTGRPLDGQVTLPGATANKRISHRHLWHFNVVSLLSNQKYNQNSTLTNLTHLTERKQLEFLMYHVVNGSYFSQDLRDGQQLASILDMKPIQVGVRVDGCSRKFNCPDCQAGRPIFLELQILMICIDDLRS